MNIKTFILIISTSATITLSGCSVDDPYADYLGQWDLNRKNNYKKGEVMEITQDGETYLVNFNILVDTNFMGQPNQAMVLKKQDGQLSVDTGFASAQFGLSSDNNTLLFTDESYKRISSNRFAEIENNLLSCRNRKNVFEKKRDLLMQKSRDLLFKSTLKFNEPEDKKLERENLDKQIKLISNQYKETQESSPDCFYL